MDDDFMTTCFAGNTACAQLVLQIILDRSDLTVVRSSTQTTVKNLLRRSVRLDVLAVDASGTYHNIEIQRADKGANPKRARYNGSLIDASISEPGEEYNALPDVYVIFITEKDLFHRNRPVYRFERMTTEDGIYLDDGSHIIYVNGAYRDESPIGLLMKDFQCTEPDEMHYDVLKERAAYFKKNPEGVGSMCRAIEEMREETARKADRAKGIKIALQMLIRGKYTIEEIAELCELTIDEVTALAATLQN